MRASTPVSSRTSRVAVSHGGSPACGPPFGSVATCGRPAGVITSTSSSRTTTPPKDSSCSIDIAAQRRGIVHGQAPAALADDARALQHGEEAAGRLARGAGELGELRLGGGDEDVARPALALRARLLDELVEHRGDP